MQPVPPSEQQALVSRLTNAYAGEYSPETRRKYFISDPQWAAAYEGQALFHAPRHDTDVIPAELRGKASGQDEIVTRIQTALAENGIACSMVTTERAHLARLWRGAHGGETLALRYQRRVQVEA
jgi:xylose isomerase